MNKLGYFFVLFAVVALFFVNGCNPFNDDSTETTPVNGLPTGNANVNIVLKTPEGQPASIRAAGGTPEVTVTLTLINAGSETQTTWTIKKTVKAEGDKAVISMESVPAKPCIGEVTITNGNINGARDFHGAADLVAGSNSLTVVPVGMGDSEDLAVEMARRLIASPALVKAAAADFIGKVKTAIKAGDFSQPLEFEKILSLVVNTLSPAGLTSITIDSGTQSFFGSRSGTQAWTISKSILIPDDFAAQGWESALEPKSVLKQGIGNSAYVYFERPTIQDASALVKINPETGARVAALGVRGRITHFLELSDGDVILGGFAVTYNKRGINETYECPFVLRWTGAANTSLMVAEHLNTAIKWAWLYESQKPSSDTYPTRASVNKLVNFGSKIMIELKKLTGGYIAETFDPTTGPVSTFNEYVAINTTVSGLAVDPYLQGTRFFYDLNDNKAFDSNEPISTPSDANGQFSITGPITDAHDLIAKSGELGRHLGKDFPFSLRTNPGFKDDQGRVIASPITSVVRYGVDMAELIKLINEEFAAAGISETLSEADLKADPFAGLDTVNVDSLTDANLLKIRAIIAVQQYLTVIKKLENDSAASFDYSVNLSDLQNTENRQILKALTQIVKNACNVEFIKASATTINSAIDTVASTVSQQSGGMFSVTDSHKEAIRNAIQIKAIDVAKACVSIAEYCSNQVIDAVKTGGKSAINEAFITALTTKTSTVMVPEIGPRYYFGRVKSVLDNPPTVTGIKTPVDVDNLIWSNIKTGVQFNGAESISGTVGVNFIDSTWTGFEGIEISGDGTSFAPLK